MFCPECGNQNPDSAKFCMKCGYQYANSHKTQNVQNSVHQNFTDTIPVKKPFQQKSKGSSLRFLLIGLFSLFSIMAVYILFFFGGSRLSTSDRIDAFTGSSSLGSGYTKLIEASEELKPNELFEKKFEIPNEWRGVQLEGQYGGAGKVKITIEDEKSFRHFEQFIDKDIINGYAGGSIDPLTLPIGHTYSVKVQNLSETQKSKFDFKLEANYAVVQKR